ncbi:MAG: LysM peptidoglycan-binding domain-containing protein [bacterium]
MIFSREIKPYKLTFQLLCCLIAFSFIGCAAAGKSTKGDSTEELVEFAEEEFIEEFDEDGSEGGVVVIEEEEFPVEEYEDYNGKEVDSNEGEASYEAQDAQPALYQERREIPAGSKEHKVWIWQETRDCLWTIARDYYGDPWKWKKIYLANQDSIYDPNIIFPKQIIYIPPDE